MHLHFSARPPARTRRTLRALTFLAALSAAALALPAAALALPAAAQAEAPPWPMPNADVGATNQSPVTGPQDPGLKWHLDLAQVETAFAPEGYRNLGDVIIADTGVMIALVASNERQYDNSARFARELIGIDLDTAEVLWEVPNVSPVSSGRCAPALDRQDRIWVEQRPDGGDRVVAAFDPATGEALGPEIDAEDQRCREQIIVGGEQERLVFSTNDAEGLRMFDISADDPVEIDVALADRDDVGTLLNHGQRDHWAVMTSDHLVTLVEIVDDEGDATEHRIVSIALDDGTTTDEVTLPTAADIDSTEIGRAYLLADDGDRVYLSTRKTGDSQILAIDAAGGDLSLDWDFDLELRAPDLTLGDGVVLFQDGRRVAGSAPSITALATDDGSLVFDDGEPVGDHPLANPDGSFYGRTTDGGTRLNEISLMGSDGQIEWRIDRGRLTQEIDGADEYDDLNLGVRMDMAAIDDDGALYVTSSEDAILALDDSGGLAQFICGDTFVDVDEDNTHACNVDEMAARGITQGVGEDRYDPSGDVPREQFATFLVRALDEVEPAATGPFTDVAPDSVHAPNIFGAAAAGITLGTTETTFAPDRLITRAEVASLLARAFELDPVEDGPFTDVESDNVHAGNINAVFEAGITRGTSDTTFDPASTLRRDQMASLLIRALDAAGVEG